jgi:non-heme chloroperoxidase
VDHEETAMTTITATERAQVEAANASGRRVVLLVHGLWAIAPGWVPWREFLEDRGFATVALEWPGEPQTFEEAIAHPEAVAGVGVSDVTDHAVDVIRALDRAPGIIGHSFGGLVTHRLAGMGLAGASVGVSPAPFRGAFGLRWSVVRGGAPVLANPANLRRAVRLTYSQFRYSWANQVSDQEARRLWETQHVACPGRPLFEAVAGQALPVRAAKADWRHPERGPMLLIGSATDRLVPLGVVRSEYARQRRNPHPTSLVEVPGRGHSLTIDHGWPAIAQLSADFLEENLHSRPTPRSQG